MSHIHSLQNISLDLLMQSKEGNSVVIAASVGSLLLPDGKSLTLLPQHSLDVDPYVPQTEEALNQDTVPFSSRQVKPLVPQSSHEPTFDGAHIGDIKAIKAEWREGKKDEQDEGSKKQKKRKLKRFKKLSKNNSKLKKLYLKGEMLLASLDELDELKKCALLERHIERKKKPEKFSSLAF